VLRVATGEQHERHATWLELMYDLVFVAAVAQLAYRVSDAYNMAGVGQHLLLFLPVWWAWVGHTFYSTRFDSDDLVHRLLTFGQMVFVAAMALHIPNAFSTGAAGFVISYCGVRAMLIYQYLRAGLKIPVARPLTSVYAGGFSLAAAIWLGSLLVPAEHRIWFWVVAIVADFATPFAAGRLNVQVPPHFSHVPERFGLFTIIVLGEQIAAVVATVAGTELGLLRAVTAALAILLAFAIWWDYFDGAGATATQLTLSTKTDVRRFRTWMYLHLPLMMLVPLVAVGIKHVLKDPSKPLPEWEGPILAVGSALIMTIHNALYFVVPDGKAREATIAESAPYMLTAAVAFALTFFARSIPGFLLTAGVSALFLVRVGFDIHWAIEESRQES
jgi:low temperature requirement protein LtrA